MTNNIYLDISKKKKFFSSVISFTFYFIFFLFSYLGAFLKKKLHQMDEFILSRLEYVLQHCVKAIPFIVHVDIFSSEFLAFDLFSLVYFGKGEELQKWIDFGANINIVYDGDRKSYGKMGKYIDLFGKTLLNVALATNRKEIIQILIKAKADLDQALFFEVENFYKKGIKDFHFHNIKFLLEKGANINIQVKPYYSSVLIANYSHTQDLYLTSMLLNQGADVNLRDIVGRTPLHQAVKYSNRQPDVIRLYLDAGVHVNVFDQNGFNTLAFALTSCWNLNKDINMLLLAAGDKIPKNTICYKNPHIVNIPEYMFPDNKLSLQNKCREVIRHQLLMFDQVNMFVKVRKLPLPSRIKDYLLFFQEWEK